MLEEKPAYLAQSYPSDVSLYGTSEGFVRALFLSNLLRAAGGKAFAAQHRSSARRLERHAVGFAALVAGYFETLALAAACASSAAAEIGATAITASLTTLRLAQISLRVIFLFAFGEWKRRAALSTSDLYVWHVQLLPTESLCARFKETFPFSSKGLALVLGNTF
jgi:hypothetical protein